MQMASGTFELAMTRDPIAEVGGTALARGVATKHFTGELAGTSTVHMLTAVTPVKGSAGYVAMEWVEANLEGKRGSFVLQHSSSMRAGEQHQQITVVPDSGAGELMGLRGEMIIRIVDGQHHYELSYELARPG